MHVRLPRSTLLLALAIAGLAIAAPAHGQVTEPRYDEISDEIPQELAPPRPVAGALPPSPLASAWRDGRLPSAAAIPAGNRDAAAARLAAQLAARDETSLPALLAALRAMGIAVRAPDGEILHYPESRPGQGLALPAWQVAAVARLYDGGGSIPLAAAASALAKIHPEVTPAQMSALLLDGVRANARGTDPARRFWARFIVELGKRGAKPYDLLAPTVAATTVRLDHVQLQLVLLRMAGDLTPPPDAAPRRTSSRAPATGGPFRLASYERSYARPYAWSYARSYAPPAPADDCKLTDTQTFILDMAAASSGVGFGALMGRLEAALGGAGGRRAEAASKFASRSGTMLNVAKTLLVLTSLEIDVSISGDELERTRDTHHHGKEAVLQAKPKLDLGKWQMVNCARPALWAAGLDFSLPNDGPLGDVKADWVILEGGTNQYRPLWFIQHMEGGPPRGTRTDAEGVARIRAVGHMQPNWLGPKAQPVTKRGVVQAAVTLSDVKDAQSLISSIVSAGLGGISAGGGDIVNLAAEMAMRVDWFSRTTYAFPIRDWAEGFYVNLVRTWNDIDADNGLGTRGIDRLFGVVSLDARQGNHLERSLVYFEGAGCSNLSTAADTVGVSRHCNEARADRMAEPCRMRLRMRGPVDVKFEDATDQMEGEEGEWAMLSIQPQSGFASVQEQNNCDRDTFETTRTHLKTAFTLYARMPAGWQKRGVPAGYTVRALDAHRNETEWELRFPGADEQ